MTVQQSPAVLWAATSSIVYSPPPATASTAMNTPPCPKKPTVATFEAADDARFSREIAQRTLEIREAARQSGQRTVVLIDEYDKPILDNLTRPVVAAVSTASEVTISGVRP